MYRHYYLHYHALWVPVASTTLLIGGICLRGCGASSSFDHGGNPASESTDTPVFFVVDGNDASGPAADETTPFSSSNVLRCRRFCLRSSTGNLFALWQILHLITRTSAHGLRPFLLLFSTEDIQVLPSIKKVSQYLHIVCLMAGLRRIWAFRATDRRSVTT